MSAPKFTAGQLRALRALKAAEDYSKRKPVHRYGPGPDDYVENKPHARASTVSNHEREHNIKVHSRVAYELEKMGFAQSELEPRPVVGGHDEYYRLTDAGRAALAKAEGQP
jgi:hypothetical protein